ncbi:hypothetical protein SAMN05421630_101724 [Prauserella marina]|uniref:Uncharacterized protein n=1 Tax=Prauserella marina TaxID=530584 RepID=A0A1G6JHR9_9PSEU|nr:hypothetical protein DES30_101612 [Prauserella marina]SDC18253.1 hypothetical protein SAMN05421630_101724 [Prauserella marina]
MVTYLMVAVLTVCLFAASWWLGAAVVAGVVLVWLHTSTRTEARR